MTESAVTAIAQLGRAAKLREMLRDGTFLAAIREARVSITECAQAVGVSRTAMHQWCTGDRSPRLNTALHLADLYDAVCSGDFIGKGARAGRNADMLAAAADAAAAAPGKTASDHRHTIKHLRDAGCSLREIANVVDCTPERVRQVLVTWRCRHGFGLRYSIQCEEMRAGNGAFCARHIGARELFTQWREEQRKRRVEIYVASWKPTDKVDLALLRWLRDHGTTLTGDQPIPVDPLSVAETAAEITRFIGQRT